MKMSRTEQLGWMTLLCIIIGVFIAVVDSGPWEARNYFLDVFFSAHFKIATMGFLIVGMLLHFLFKGYPVWVEVTVYVLGALTIIKVPKYLPTGFTKADLIAIDCFLGAFLLIGFLIAFILGEILKKSDKGGQKDTAQPEGKPCPPEAQNNGSC